VDASGNYRHCIQTNANGVNPLAVGADGPRELQVDLYAKDEATPLIPTQTRSYTVDTTPPTLDTITFDPVGKDDAFITGTVPGDYTEGTISLLLAGQQYTGAIDAATNTFKVPVPAAVVANAENVTATATVKDEAGNTATKSWTEDVSDRGTRGHSAGDDDDTECKVGSIPCWLFGLLLALALLCCSCCLAALAYLLWKKCAKEEEEVRPVKLRIMEQEPVQPKNPFEGLTSSEEFSSDSETVAIAERQVTTVAAHPRGRLLRGSRTTSVTEMVVPEMTPTSRVDETSYKGKLLRGTRTTSLTDMKLPSYETGTANAQDLVGYTTYANTEVVPQTVGSTSYTTYATHNTEVVPQTVGSTSYTTAATADQNIYTTYTVAPDQNPSMISTKDSSTTHTFGH